MTNEKLQDLIDHSCRDYFGIIQTDNLRRFLNGIADQITTTQYWNAFGQIVYDRKFDQRKVQTVNFFFREEGDFDI